MKRKGVDAAKISGRIWVMGVSAPAAFTGFAYETMRRWILFVEFLASTAS